MRRTFAPSLVVLTALVLAIAPTGCKVTSKDDETSSPTPSAPSSSPSRSLPATVPVGHGDVDPGDVVWAQGGVIHVGSRQWDLSPLHVDSLAVVSGGLFVLSGGQLWFTDLVRARAAGITAATRVTTTADGSAVRVTAGEPPTTGAWNAATGRAVPVEQAPERPATERDGPGPFAILGRDRGPLQAFRTSDGQRVRLSGVVGDGFDLVRWTSGTTFYGLALVEGRPSAVLDCDLAARTCTTRGRVASGQPVVVDSGT
jgi:hypothetical protein